MFIKSTDGQKYGSHEDYYDGEVFLFPPKQKPPGMQTSMGIIEIQLDNTQKSIALRELSDVAMHLLQQKEIVHWSSH